MVKGWGFWWRTGLLTLNLAVRCWRGSGFEGVLVCLTSTLWSDGNGVGVVRENWSAYPQPCSQMAMGWGLWGSTGLLNLNLVVRWQCGGGFEGILVCLPSTLWPDGGGLGDWAKYFTACLISCIQMGVLCLNESMSLWFNVLPVLPPPSPCRRLYFVTLIHHMHLTQCISMVGDYDSQMMQVLQYSILLSFKC